MMPTLHDRYKQLGHDVSASCDLPQTLRINTLRIDEKKCIDRLQKRGVHLHAIPGLKHAYTFSSPFPIVSCEEYLLGYVYLQETASMWASQALLEGESPTRILDMCAAPGSKTTHLAQLTQNSVDIIALDITTPRLQKLVYNCERLGVTSVTSVRKDARFAFDISGEFSHILLDAPCSGNVCVEKDFFQKRSPRDFKERSRLQKELFRAAYAVLAEGGVLVYSTCSLEPEEDELVVQWALETFDDLTLQNVAVPADSAATTVFGKQLDDRISLAKKFWPPSTQGFFIARFQKNF